MRFFKVNSFTCHVMPQCQRFNHSMSTLSMRMRRICALFVLWQNGSMQAKSPQGLCFENSLLKIAHLTLKMLPW